MIFYYSNNSIKSDVSKRKIRDSTQYSRVAILQQEAIEKCLTLYYIVGENKRK